MEGDSTLFQACSLLCGFIAIFIFIFFISQVSLIYGYTEAVN